MTDSLKTPAVALGMLMAAMTIVLLWLNHSIMPPLSSVALAVLGLSLGAVTAFRTAIAPEALRTVAITGIVGSTLALVGSVFAGVPPYAATVFLCIALGFAPLLRMPQRHRRDLS
ncbi:hypothetical protein [Helcobacillus massiliensis]|uniref:hypothetical protein n=1 Tax=Helcobacillus massiliensis TaxID=521392 RepID=UPI002553BDE6|nr:hypothetical protein [Helcobacillus massiliensis]MDK7741324.1 hypothetical protein [Helcobacillus massiliensis]WOO92825.1 hypothetical protein R3I40_10520 [Helcobacillus massiliensis]